jgi:hypothetical protein
MHEKITSPDQLKTLTAQELLERVHPILRHGGLTSPPRRYERIRPNILSVIWDLAVAWQAAPRLDGRPVKFDEYLAARLCGNLHSLDRQQHPHLHRGGYRPENEPLPLDNAHGLGVMASYPSFASDEWKQRLTDTANIAAIAQASQDEMLSRVTRTDAGEPMTGYRWKRLNGASIAEARRTPANDVIRFIRDLLDS